MCFICQYPSKMDANKQLVNSENWTYKKNKTKQKNNIIGANYTKSSEVMIANVSKRLKLK